MQAVLVISAIFVAIRVSGDSYDYSYSPISGAEPGFCQFQGYISNSGSDLCKTETITRQDFTQGGDLTWEILTSACPELVYAGCADPDWDQGAEHNMTRDLVWPSSCGSCPRCPCLINGTDILPQYADDDTENNTYYLRNYTLISSNYPQWSNCQKCSCTSFNYLRYNSTIGRSIYQYAYDCSSYINYYLPYQFNNTYCDDPEEFTTTTGSPTTDMPTADPTPGPTGGCDDGTGSDYDIGEYYFGYFEENGTRSCDIFCLCTASGSDCVQGYENILARTDFRREFLNECQFYLDDAYDDPSRMFLDPNLCRNWYYPSVDYSAYYHCPRATCGNYSLYESWKGASWSYGYYDEINMTEIEYYNCELCTCYRTIYSDGDSSQVQCSTREYNLGSPDECWIKDPIINCSTTYEEDKDDIKGSSTSCSIPDSYCGWDKGDIPKGFDPDTVCITDELPSGGEDWGCQNDEICIAAFGYEKLNNSETGLCSYNEISFTAQEYDCINYEWKSETYTIDYNFMCCGSKAGDFCNNQEISKDALGKKNKCEAKAGINSYIKALYECQYSNRGVTNDDYIKQLKCGKALPEANNLESRVCDLIENRWKWQTACECQQLQALEKAFGGSDYEDNLREQMQEDFDTSNSGLAATLELYNQYYDCGKTFECDIYSSSGNTIKMSFLSVIFIAFVNYYL